MNNTFGQLFTLTSFGESHGPAIGGVIDGCPAGLLIDFEAIDRELLRRRPGRSLLSSTRQEPDKVEFISGIFNGKTTGMPIAFMVRNANQRSADYEATAQCYRPGHADLTYNEKYGFRDYRGGGRSSGRETIARVVAGAIAAQLLSKLGVTVYAYTSQIGDICSHKSFSIQQLEQAQSSFLGCPDVELSVAMEELINQVRAEGDSIGGVVTVVAKGVPLGWGEPVFNKLNARLAYAMNSIGGVKGFEFGDGFASATMRGSQMNDAMTSDGRAINFSTNHAGGVLGGISNGNDIFFRVAFKPTPSIACLQHTIDTNLNNQTIQIHGRHDPCIVPRAVSVVRAMTNITLYDAFLMASHQII